MQYCNALLCSGMVMPSLVMAKSCLVKCGTGEVMQRLVLVMHCYAEFSEGYV